MRAKHVVRETTRPTGRTRVPQAPPSPQFPRRGQSNYNNVIAPSSDAPSAIVGEFNDERARARRALRRS